MPSENWALFLDLDGTLLDIAQHPDLVQVPAGLVLSRFAGAVEELDDALIVNPFDADGLAEAMDQALKMPLDERKSRWAGMWRRVRSQSAAVWRKKFLEELGA